VREFRPLGFDHGPHFVGDMINMLDIEHVFVQPPQIRRHHDLATDDARRVGALVLQSPARRRSRLGRGVGQALAAEPLPERIGGNGIGEAEADVELLRLMPRGSSA
jgi:hypothetical protein